MKLVFVILHYNTTNNTIDCVSSIRENLKGKDYHIVIVDNASPNGSFTELNNLYGIADDVTLILNQENMGFARGNNVGYMYAKMELKANFIAVINNDIKILQSDLIEQIEVAFENEQFSVMGPMILSADGKYTSNPVRLKLITREGVDRVISYYKKELRLLKYNILWLQELFHKIKELWRTVPDNEIDYLKVYKNVELHGCCLIFSPYFIQQYDGFDSRTFMYEEERILYKHMMDDGGLMLYNPKIIVFHKERATTSQVNKKTNDQKYFLWENSLDSANVLRSLFNDEE